MINLASIDIGSNGARLLIKRFDPEAIREEDRIKKLMFIRIPLRLGKDVFTLGKVSKEREKMMLHMMRMSGMKNPTQMLRSEWRVQFIPDEQVLEAAANGSIVPMGSGGGEASDGASANAPMMAGPGQQLSGRFSDVLERATNG